jgi:Rrf2 family protein
MLLAAEPTRSLRVREVCEVIPASESHLAKVLQRLARAGLVSSSRGPRGGFTLARPAARVTLLQIYRAIEGDAPKHSCLLGRKQCVPECILGDLVSRTNAEVERRLGKTRLADVAGAFKRGGRA